MTNIPELIDPNKVFKIFKELGPSDIEQLTIFLNEHQHSIENIRFSRERYEFLDNVVILLLKNGILQEAFNIFLLTEIKGPGQI